MKEHLRDKAKQEVLEKTHGELEIGPVVAVFESLEGIHLKINLTIEVLLVEDLHGDFALAAVCSTVMLGVELQVVFDGAATVLGLLSLAGRDRRRDAPESHENGNSSEESEENGGVEAAANLAGQVPGCHEEQEGHQAIGKAIASRRIGRDGGILDSRILEAYNS